MDNPWVFARGSGVAVPPATNLSSEFWNLVGSAMQDRLDFGPDGTGRNEEPLVNWPQQASAPLLESKFGAIVGAMPLRFGHTAMFCFVRLPFACFVSVDWPVMLNVWWCAVQPWLACLHTRK